MRFLSVCSGIECASVAWKSLGWQPLAFSEIEAFPSAVLAHRYPDVPNLGDLTRWREWPVDVLRVDLLIGGTPCQAFSVAGKREGLNDDRGALSQTFAELADAIDDLRRADGAEPVWILWENVPGVLSDKTNGFGCLLGALCGSGAAIDPPSWRNWTDAGLATGPERSAAWRVLDAQHFGLAQRRRRVFVLARAGARTWSVAECLLPISQGVPRDPFAFRKARKATAARTAARIEGGDLARCLLSGDSAGKRGDFETETLITGTLQSGGKAAGSATQQDAESGLLIAHSLRGEGFDASEDGTGRGVPLVTGTLSARTRAGGGLGTDFDLDGGLQVSPALRARSNNSHRADSMAFVADVSPSLRTQNRNNSNATTEAQSLVAHAFDARQSDVIQYGDQTGPLDTDGTSIGVLIHGSDGTASTASLTETAACLRARAPGLRDNSTTTAVLSVALRGRDGGATAELGDDRAGTLRASGGGGDKPHVLSFDLAQITSKANRTRVEPDTPTSTLSANSDMHAAVDMAVRRLTPKECERLQGLPDGYTLIPTRKRNHKQADMLDYLRAQRPDLSDADLRKLAADGPRYKAIGNGMAVPVIRWIGRAIEGVSR